MSVAFSTLNVNVSYEVEHGGPDEPIRVTIDSCPSLPPDYNRINEIYLVFKWTVRARISVRHANWFQLHLFKPKGDDPGAFVAPPPVVDPIFGHRVTGTNPQKEDSDLWNNYINMYYDPMPADHHYKFSDTLESLTPERDNTQWPGNRGRHKTLGKYGTYCSPIWLRVATTLISAEEYPHTFLLLFEIRRTKRLRLVPVQILVKSKKGFCFIATAAYGNPMSMELGVLRNWRDKTLKRTSMGRGFVDLYYRTSPLVARIISRSETMRKCVRGVLSPIVNMLRRRARQKIAH